MSWDGSGNFLRLFSWVADKAAGLDISSTRMDSDTNNITLVGFGNCITRDGQGQPTANLPMAGFKHTGAALGVAATDYALFQQLKNGNTNVPSNLQINASVGSNILTISLKSAASGADATASDPIYIPFRDSTIASGDPVVLSVTGALSITTFATGATLGASNSTPFRFWVVAFNNAGTIVLGLINCSTVNFIFALNEAAAQSSTAMTAGATSAGVFYTPNGAAVSSKTFRILGYVEYASGLATAGTYGSTPTTIQLFGPGIKKPGDIVQISYATQSSNTTASGANSDMNVGANIVPTSNVNWISANINFSWNSNASSSASFFISRGTSPVSAFGAQFSLLGNASVGLGGAASSTSIDTATTTSRAVSYHLFASGSSVSMTGTQSTIVTELMG